MLVRIFFLFWFLQCANLFAQSFQVSYDFTKYWVNGNWVGELHQVPGQTAIPVVVAKILLPFGGTLASMTALPQAGTPVQVKSNFKMVPKAVPLCETPVPDVPGCEVKDWNTVKYPVGDPLLQEKYGFRVVLVPIYPVQYDPNNQVATSLQTLTLDVEVSDMPQSANFRGIADDSVSIRSFVDNPSMADTYPTTVQSPSQKAYLVIAPRAWIGSFQPLFDEKASRNIQSNAIAIEDIQTEYSGKDLQEKIRNAIMDHYRNEGTEYVLLVGDGYTILPSRKFRVVASQTADIASDMYYACLDGDFDSNGNGIYGETTDGPGGAEVDLLCEVSVGRAPLSTLNQVGPFVTKTLAAQTLADNDPRIWNTLLFGEKADDQTLASWMLEKLVTGDLEEGVDSVGFAPNTIFTRLYETFQKSVEAANVFDAINNGTFYVVNHAGHANAQFDMKFPDYLIPLLKNAMPFFGYSQGCNAGDLSQKNWASDMVTSPGGGAFAMIANSSLGYFDSGKDDGPSNIFHRMFFDTVFNDGVSQLGNINQQSKEKLINEVEGDPIMRWIFFETNLLGDPEAPLKYPHSQFRK